jgi:hypothetical protein
VRVWWQGSGRDWCVVVPVWGILMLSRGPRSGRPRLPGWGKLVGLIYKLMEDLLAHLLSRLPFFYYLAVVYCTISVLDTLR